MPAKAPVKRNRFIQFADTTKAVNRELEAHLCHPLAHAYDVLGFDTAAGGDEVFRALVLARIIEPTSKLDSLRVLDEAGSDPPSYRTVQRRLPAYAKDAWRERWPRCVPRTPDWGRRACAV